MKFAFWFFLLIAAIVSISVKAGKQASAKTKNGAPQRNASSRQNGQFFPSNATGDVFDGAANGKQIEAGGQGLGRRPELAPRVGNTHTARPAQNEMKPSVHAVTTAHVDAANATRHIVHSSSLDGHVHTESSMSGAFSDCEPYIMPDANENKGSADRDAGKAERETDGNGFASLFSDRDSIIRGMVMSEILSPPLALRQRHR